MDWPNAFRFPPFAPPLQTARHKVYNEPVAGCRRRGRLAVWMEANVTMGAVAESKPQVARGLEGIVAAATSIAEVDGERGKLTLRGYDITELSGRVSFEEVAYLLWHGQLPTQPEYNDLAREMRGARQLAPQALAALRDLAGCADGMHVL